MNELRTLAARYEQGDIKGKEYAAELEKLLTHPDVVVRNIAVQRLSLLRLNGLTT